MFIVEGTDGVGKTTFAKKICSALEKHGPWIYRHMTKHPETWKYPESYFPHLIRHVVYDRFHLSEIAYRMARNESPRLSRQHTYFLEGRIRLLGGYTVIILLDKEMITQRHKTDDMHTSEIHQKVNEVFKLMKGDCDMVINCTLKKPFPTKQDFYRCFLEYLNRQGALDEIL